MKRSDFLKTSVAGLIGMHSVPSLLGKGFETKDVKDSERMAWFEEARFGLFLHWGLYSVLGGEWNGKETEYAEWIMLKANIPVKRYEQYAHQFNPFDFDARKWVAVAKAAGMKYLVITAKHHDGFCMFKSKLTNYNIADATPFRRDPIKELSEACKEAGIIFCVYYSIVDWHYPNFPSKYSQIRKEFPRGYPGNGMPNADINIYNRYMQGQLRELLSNYGPMGIIWFDGGASFKNYDRISLLQGKKVVRLIRDLQPDCLINNRLGIDADYGTPEQKIPKTGQDTAFEVCMTLNDNWGYNKYDNNWKSPKEVIRNLVDIASKGGNYLLNIGPTGAGNFPQPSVDILEEVGNWMKIHGESIYGTKAGPNREDIHLHGGMMTQKEDKLYLHILNWPDDSKVFVEGMKGHIVKKAYFLEDKNQTSLPFDAYDRSVMIQVPEHPINNYDNVIVLSYKKNADLT